MLAWIFRKKKPYDTNEVLNHGLKLAMAFGKEWMQPIQTRLVKKYPELTKEEQDEYNSICQKAMRYGHDKMYSFAENERKNVSQEEFNKYLLKEFSWVNDKIIKDVYNQGLYYVHKDFGF